MLFARLSEDLCSCGSGVDGFVQGMWRPPSFMEKLLSGKPDQGDRELGVSLGGSQASLRPSDLVWSGVDNFVRGTWRPPSFMEKLLSGKQDQGDCGDLVLPEET